MILSRFDGFAAKDGAIAGRDRHLPQARFGGN
jgi:hypothetical protein